MIEVYTKVDTLSAAGLALGWLLAAQSLLLALVVAVIGQGAGSWLGGCRWIGASIPIHRQVWALVNQPNLAFASEPAAYGYWLGSLVFPLVVALTLVLAFQKVSSFNAELMLIHTAWAFAVVAGAWLPMLDPEDGHLRRWLHFADLPQSLVWAAPAMASGIAVLAALRLLAVTRISRRHSGRGVRVLVIVLHLCLPSAAFVIAACVVIGEPPLLATVAAAAPLACAITLAWFRYPPLPVHGIRESSLSDVLRAVVAVVLLSLLCWGSGRPLPEDRCAGILWSRPLATNNLRDWIDAGPLLWWKDGSSRGEDGSRNQVTD